MRTDSFLYALTENVIGAAISVHQTVGAGLLESVYKAFLVTELRSRGLDVATELSWPLLYKGVRLDVGFRADMIVEKSLLVEVKSVDKLAPVHQAQVITYLKLSGCPVGLLFNFNVPILRHGIRRLTHPVAPNPGEATEGAVPVSGEGDR